MLLALLPLLFASLPSTSVGEGPFLELEFSAALEQAQASEKLVFIDFFTTWCGPCKKLDQVTWKDAEVVAWLAEHTVPLKLDAEIEVELAKRYAVDRYPTMVFIAPDGELRGRLTGYMAPKVFLTKAPVALAGIKASAALRVALEKDPNGWDAHSDLADALVQEQLYAEALELYLWCFDHGLEHNKGYAGVRVSFLLGDITALGRKYPPALEALRERRDAAAKRISGGVEGLEAVMDLCAINRDLGESDHTLALYDRLLEEQGPVDIADRLDPRAQLFDACIELLVKRERFQDVIDGFGDVHAWLDALDANYRRVGEVMKGADDENDTENLMRGMTVTKAAKLYRALASVEGEDGSLVDLEQAVIEFHPVLKTWSSLMYAARKAGRRDLQERLRASALEQLPEDEHRRVPRVRGQ